MEAPLGPCHLYECGIEVLSGGFLYLELPENTREYDLLVTHLQWLGETDPERTLGFKIRAMKCPDKPNVIMTPHTPVEGLIGLHDGSDAVIYGQGTSVFALHELGHHGTEPLLLAVYTVFRHSYSQRWIVILGPPDPSSQVPADG